MESEELKPPDDDTGEVVRTLMDLKLIPPSDFAGAVIRIKFQAGPIKKVGINGCQIEDVIDVLVERLEGFQRGPLPCAENKMALNMLLGAQGWLRERTLLRQQQGVEGTVARHES